MENSSLIGLLAILTLLIVLGAAIWFWRQARQSQTKRGEKAGGGISDI